MPEKSPDPRDTWRSQPPELDPVDARRLAAWRARDLYVRTRLEIFTSIAAAVLLVLILQWRFAWTRETVPVAAAVAVAVWAAISLYRFRTLLSLRDADHPAAPGADHYRRALERRRDHLRSFWLWHGPVALAGFTLAATAAGKHFTNPQGLVRALPFTVLLVVWIALGIRRRRAEVRHLNDEIAEVDLARKAP